MPALLEEALCRRQALLRVDVVDNHDAIAGFDASLEHIAVGHHRLAIETGQRGNVRMRSRGDDHDVANHVKIVFTNLGSEAGPICKQPLCPITTPQCWETMSPNPINKAFPYMA